MKIVPARPYFPQEDREIIHSEIEDVLENGMMTVWNYTKRFEESIKKYIGCKYAIGVNSGTSGLHLAMIILGIKKGDEVIIPTNTMAATTNCVLYTGAKPVFADMDFKTYTLDPFDVKRKITDKTKAIIPMHHSGNMCEMDTIRETARENDLFVVEDAAHALGSKFKGKFAGTFSDIGVFSFYPTKVITSGEGGMMVTDNKEYAELARILRDQGKKSFFSYEIIKLGYNYRMTEIQAILGYHQLKHLEEWIKRRNEIGKKYTQAIKELNSRYQFDEEIMVPPYVPKYVRHNFYKYMVKANKRETIRKALKKDGVSTSLQYDPLAHQQPYLGLEHLNPKCYTANKLYKRIFSLPTYNQMTDEEVNYVCDCIKSL